MRRITKLEQALAAEQQATAELKQALALEQQATASQAQEIAALKQTLATQGQAVQGMDANIAQMMQAVQAMMGPVHGELVELRRRVAMLEAARPAGACMAVKPIKKEPA
jgi:predicted ABC-class ATPase